MMKEIEERKKEAELQKQEIQIKLWKDKILELLSDPQQKEPVACKMAKVIILELQEDKLNDKIFFLFQSGDLNLTFSYLWTQIYEEIDAKPGKMETIADEVAMLKDRIGFQKTELDRLKTLISVPQYRMDELENSIVDWTKKAVELNLSLVKWKKFEMKDFRRILNTTKLIKNAERKLLELVKSTIYENPAKILDWGEIENSLSSVGDLVSLSLVLNTFRIPLHIVKILYPLNGYSFLQPRALYDTLTFYGVFDDFETRSDLAFIQEMLIYKKIPFVDHVDDCPVCCCANVKDFVFLLEEHKKIINFDILHRYNIVGHRFLHITRTDCIRLFNETKENVEALMKVVHYFHKIHLDCFQ